MDILAVDQSSEEARIQVVTQIPQIYRKARFTVVIREKGGFCSDCFGAMEELDVSDDDFDTPGDVALCGAVVRNFQALDQHLRDCHPGGIQEFWMERN